MKKFLSILVTVLLLVNMSSGMVFAADKNTSIHLKADKQTLKDWEIEVDGVDTYDVFAVLYDVSAFDDSSVYEGPFDDGSGTDYYTIRLGLSSGIQVYSPDFSVTVNPDIDYFIVNGVWISVTDERKDPGGIFEGQEGQGTINYWYDTGEGLVEVSVELSETSDVGSATWSGTGYFVVGEDSEDDTVVTMSPTSGYKIVDIEKFEYKKDTYKPQDEVGFTVTNPKGSNVDSLTDIDENYHYIIYTQLIPTYSVVVNVVGPGSATVSNLNENQPAMIGTSEEGTGPFSYAFTPSTGYYITGVTVDQEDESSDWTSGYEIEALYQDYVITVYTAEIPYTLDITYYNYVTDEVLLERDQETVLYSHTFIETYASFSGLRVYSVDESLALGSMTTDFSSGLAGTTYTTQPISANKTVDIYMIPQYTTSYEVVGADGSAIVTPLEGWGTFDYNLDFNFDYSFAAADHYDIVSVTEAVGEEEAELVDPVDYVSTIDELIADHHFVITTAPETYTVKVTYIYPDKANVVVWAKTDGSTNWTYLDDDTVALDEVDSGYYFESSSMTVGPTGELFADEPDKSYDVVDISMNMEFEVITSIQPRYTVTIDLPEDGSASNNGDDEGNYPEGDDNSGDGFSYDFLHDPHYTMDVVLKIDDGSFVPVSSLPYGFEAIYHDYHFVVTTTPLNYSVEVVYDYPDKDDVTEFDESAPYQEDIMNIPLNDFDASMYRVDSISDSTGDEIPDNAESTDVEMIDEDHVITVTLVRTYDVDVTIVGDENSATWSYDIVDTYDAGTDLDNLFFYGATIDDVQYEILKLEIEKDGEWIGTVYNQQYDLLPLDDDYELIVYTRAMTFGMTIDKSAVVSEGSTEIKGLYETNEDVIYRFVVDNQGNQPLTNIIFRDDIYKDSIIDYEFLLEEDGIPVVLAPKGEEGDSYEFFLTVSFPTEGIKENIAYVDAYEEPIYEGEGQEYEPEPVASADDEYVITVDDGDTPPPPPRTVYYTLTLGSTDGGDFNIYEGTRTFPAGTVVDVSYSIEDGYYFVGFSDTSDDNDIVDNRIRMNSNKTLFISFAEEEIIPPPEEIPEGVPEEILDEEITLAAPEIPDEPLPQTGGLPMAANLAVGALVSFAGLGLRRGKRK